MANGPEHSSKDLQSPSEAAGQPNTLALLRGKCRSINDLLVEKEKLLLCYVFDGVSKSYYNRWKREANRAFLLRVRLERRAERIARETAA